MKRLCLFFGLASIPFAAAAQTSTQYQYDVRGRLITVESGDGWKTTYATDAADNRTQLRVQNQFETSYLAKDLYHIAGFEQWGGWAANVATAPSHIVYGPYSTTVPTGSRVASWRMLVDNVTAIDGPVVLLDVYDATASTVLASRTVNRREWVAAFHKQVFEVPFNLPTGSAGHAIEMRVYYIGASYVNVDLVGYY